MTGELRTKISSRIGAPIFNLLLTLSLPVCFRTLNLIIEVEVAGQKQYSTPKDDVLVNSDSPI